MYVCVADTLLLKNEFGKPMSHMLNVTEKGDVTIVSKNVPYVHNVALLHQTLCTEKKNCLLLESANTHSDSGRKSLLLTDAAVRVVCHGTRVELQALTENGKRVLRRLAEQKLAVSQCISTLNQTLTLHFNSAATDRDDISSHQEPSGLDALRIIKNSFIAQDDDEYALFLGGLISYDHLGGSKAWDQVESEVTSCPDYVFYLAETLILVDHQAKQSRVQVSIFDDSEHSGALAEPILTEVYHQCCEHLTQSQMVRERVNSDLISVVNDSEFSLMVERARSYIGKGEISQIALSRQFMWPCSSAYSAYKELKHRYPAPYMAYMQDELFTLFCTSPASALKYDRHTNRVETTLVSASCPTSKVNDNAIQLKIDKLLELELKGNQTECSGHLDLVELAHKDIGKVSVAGSCDVRELLKVDRCKNSVHLLSRIVGQLQSGLDALHAYQKCMYSGMMTGIPRERAMQLIRELEPTKRGSFGGAVCYFTGNGSFDSCTVNRSVYVEDNTAVVQAATTIMYDSEPQIEIDEIDVNIHSIISAIH